MEKGLFFKSKFFKYGSYLLLALLIIFMLGKIDYFFSPFISFAYSIIFPLLFGGILYYVLRPLVNIIQKARVPRVLAIVLAFVLVLIVLVILSSYTGVIVKEQATEFINSIPNLLQKAQDTLDSLLSSNLLSYFNTAGFEEKITSFVQSISRGVGTLTINFIGAITNIGSIIIIIPVVLFYFLKDDGKLAPSLLRFVPKSHKSNLSHILKDIDNVLSNYIAGQLLVAFAIGVLMYIGYLIIGLEYSLILAIFAMICCIIPFFGPWIGIVPAVLLSLADNPFMGVKVFIVMMVVQQIDNNFISPQVMKKSMDIHPLTVILLLMGILPIMGFIGLIIVIPLYSAIKITIKNILLFYYPKYADMFEIEGHEEHAPSLDKSSEEK